MARKSTNGKRGIFSGLKAILRSEPDDEVEARKLKAKGLELQREQEDVNDKRRQLLKQIDILTARARAKKKEANASSGPKKKILERQLMGILQNLQTLTKRDNRLDARLRELDAAVGSIEEILAAKATGVTEDVLEDILEAKEDAIEAEAERAELTKELAGTEFDEEAETMTSDDLAAELGLDLDEEEPSVTVDVAPADTVQQREEATPEKIQRSRKELDRLMADLDLEEE